MTGKSYSIKEMKTIVDYLTENKLYGEIRGRKMWMDYANTSLTTRTWQSLKETFLKRILPDIHNPYYKLNMAQINSFRSGYDVSDKNRNKLEVHTVSDDSGSNGPNQLDTSKSNSDYGIKEEIIAGENIKCSKIAQSRSSADTVIVDTCYETAEDIQKDLESPTGDTENGETKSLRDCITYSEPLTPMLQEVLDDFQSEPEIEPEASDRENLEIVHSVPDDAENTETIKTDASKIEKVNGKLADVANEASKKDSDSTVVPGEDSSDPKSKNDVSNDKSSKDTQPSKSDVQKELDVVCLDDSPAQNGELDSVEKNTAKNETKEKTKKQMTKNDESIVASNSENSDVVVVHASNSEIIHPSGGLNNSNNTDASLPNNPEALKKRLSNEKATERAIEKLAPPKNIADNKGSRKRSNSEDTAKIAGNKKTKVNKVKSKATSETEGRRKMETIAEGKSKSVKQVGKQKKVEIIANNKDNIAPKDDTVVENLANILDKPSTSITNDVDKVLLTSDTDQSELINGSTEIKNPCLQNVSLFDEELNKVKYTTSESEIDQNKKKNEENKDKNTQELQNEVVMLKSHTESDSEELPSPPPKKQRAGVVSTKTDRDRALANVFGFSSGASYSKRRRQLSRRRRTISQNNVSHNNGGSNSSEWTSEMDSEVYVSPPRSRKNRPTRKYLKPQSGRILSLEEEGGLFVMYGKKIYPLVKDGKIVKNYLTYLPESDSEDEQSYWRMKYEEEKKKADELKKLLQKAKEPNSRKSTSTVAKSSLLRSTTCSHNQPETSSNTEICLHDDNKIETKPSAPENIKIKFTTKNDQEIHLEGNWPQIHNVLEHVVHIFHKEPQPVSESRSKVVVDPPSSSGIATPVIITPVQEPHVDPEVHEKVNKIENEIFKEIEERDKEEQNDTDGKDVNVTKRKAGRPRKSSSLSATQSPAKRLKTANESPAQKPELNNSNDKPASETASDVTNEASKRQSRTPRKTLNESLKDSDTKTVQTRRSKLGPSEVDNGNEEEDVRYMFPPKTKRANKKTKPHKSTEAPKSFSSPETVCSNSLESTHGYQDSDPSPMKMDLRKKKKINFSELKAKTKSHVRRNSIKRTNPNLYCDDSNNSSFGDTIKKKGKDNSTLNTDVYRSESYQLLMPAKCSFRHLDPIDETSPMKNEVDYIKHLNSTANNEIFSIQMTSDIGSSSNISLPLSPELSVVESLSVSKDLLNAIDGGPTINEMQCNETIVPTTCSQYLISDIDVSVPLMQQECGLESCNEIDNKQKSLVTNSLLNKIGTFNIGDQTTITDTLDARLRDLLLESAKKMAAQSEPTINMDVDETNVEVQKKGKNKKRCSTPRKRNNSQKSKKVPNVPTVIVEEHVQTYSKGGRQSCPPIIQADALEHNEVNEVKIADLTINEKIKPKGRKKKDVLKVKILKPKSKKSHNDTIKSVQDNKKSIGTDSGINDTESDAFLRGDESVDLIHNHSETCLHANDCVRDSIDFVENSMKSILTLGDSILSCDNLRNENECEFSKANISLDYFCNNARDVKGFFNINSNGFETIYHTPKTDSSLITEDLSDDLPEQQGGPNKWYLLSEDETTNTNMANVQDTSGHVTSFGANLQQIFPITCAVPDLSTITEMSNENSRKPMMEGIGDTLDSQMFDSNF